MVLKRHEDKPWEWKDNECFTNQFPETTVECDGAMELKDVNMMGGSLKFITEEGKTFPIYVAPYLEKTWVCNKCGHVFVE